MPTIARRVVVRGRVQGVGYRAGAVQAASALGVVGWVRNMFDGSVEAFVQGPQDVVDRFVAWCRRGPATAAVESVNAFAAPTDPSMSKFTHLPTA